MVQNPSPSSTGFATYLTIWTFMWSLLLYLFVFLCVFFLEKWPQTVNCKTPNNWQCAFRQSALLTWQCFPYRVFRGQQFNIDAFFFFSFCAMDASYLGKSTHLRLISSKANEQRGEDCEKGSEKKKKSCYWRFISRRIHTRVKHSANKQWTDYVSHTSLTQASRSKVAANAVICWEMWVNTNMWNKQHLVGPCCMDVYHVIQPFSSSRL